MGGTIRDILTDLREARDEYTVLPASDMGILLKNYTKQYETIRLVHALKYANTIAQAGVMPPGKNKRKLMGPRDAANYLMVELQSGIFHDTDGLSNRVVDVKDEVMELGKWWDKRQEEDIIETGIPGVQIDPTNFVGVLGYLLPELPEGY